MSDTDDQDRPATRWEPLKAHAHGSRKWLLGLGFLVALAFLTTCHRPLCSRH